MKLAVISTYNTKCGIAEYTHSLYSPIESGLDIQYIANYDVVDRKYEDTDKVKRLWKIKDTKYKGVIDYLKIYKPDIVHIQAHSAHHTISGLDNLIEGIHHLPFHPKIFLTPHIVHTSQYDISSVKNTLQLVDRIFVHSMVDVHYLMSKGVYNVGHFVHPYPDVTVRDRETLKSQLGIDSGHIIATHGIISPHKGFRQVIKAFDSIKKDYPDALLLMLTPRSVTNPSSEQEYNGIKQMLTGSSKDVVLFDTFLEETALTTLLQIADIGILAYEEIGESASGAIRKFLSCGVPTVVTDIPIMQEFEAEVYKVPARNQLFLEKAIGRLLVSTDIRKTLRANALKTAKQYSFSNSAELLLRYYTK